jgi:hypothetical protein
MSFSASTCLIYTGTTTLIDPISIYSDFNGYSSPFTAVTLSDITSDNCPFILTNIPNGTTTLKLKSSNNYCCNIVLECNDLCTTCDLSFDSYSTDLISRIIAGNLTGSCDNNITDYRINWYKDGDFITPIFASGYGTQFTPYNYTHPLVGNTSPMQPSGIYTPIIDKITINGLNYSQTEEPGFIQANLACFNSLSVNVLPFTCDNGSELGNYTHRVNFSGASEGVTPLSLTSVFELSDTTNYFAWKFKAFTIYDSLKITFFGSSYSEPLVLEYYTLGFDGIVSSDINPLIYHKTGRTDSNSYYSKITSLENITTNIGDYLILEVTPNQTNPQTNWDFYFTCLDTFDCSLCLDSYVNTNTSYKIKLNSLTNVSGSCESTVVSFDISGCSTNSFYYDSDIGKYMVTNLYDKNETSLSSVAIYPPTNLGTIEVNANNGSVICNLNGSGTLNGVCSPSNSNSISFQKSVSMGQGIINMTFSHLSDLSSYYNAILPYSGMTFPSTDIRYYKYIQLKVPKSTSPGQICGDGTTQLSYYIHPSFTMTSGGTTGNYTLDMTMPTISKNISFTSCELYCDNYANQVVNGINISSTGSTNNESFSSTTGSRYTQSTTTIIWSITQTSLDVASGNTNMGIYYFGDYTNVTIPFSGSGVSYTPIPSLSAQTCDMTGIGQASYEPGLREIYIYNYRTVFPDTNDLTSYTIKTSPIVNGVSNNSYSVDVITVVNNVVTYSNPLYTF